MQVQHGGIGLLMLALTLAGCSQSAGLATGSLTPAAAPTPTELPNTPDNRIKNLAWNSAWAQTCGFYYDNAKLKSSYLAYESQAGTPPETVAKLAAAFDKAQMSFRVLGTAHQDSCTDARLDRIRSSVARYLASDFTPGSAV